MLHWVSEYNGRVLRWQRVCEQDRNTALSDLLASDFWNQAMATFPTEFWGSARKESAFSRVKIYRHRECGPLRGQNVLTSGRRTVRVVPRRRYDAAQAAADPGGELGARDLIWGRGSVFGFVNATKHTTGRVILVAYARSTRTPFQRGNITYE